MSRLGMKCVMIVVALMAISLVDGEAAGSERTAVLLFRGGEGGDVWNSSMRQLYDDLEPQCDSHGIDIDLKDNKRFRQIVRTQEQYEELNDFAVEYKKKYTRIALIAHSLGGTSAYQIAFRLLDNGVSVLLVTLDAVSVPPNRWRDTPSPYRWLNVYTGTFPSAWNYEPGANRNVLFHVGHSEVVALFQPVREEVMQYLGIQ